jgi:hypothetical protein
VPEADICQQDSQFAWGEKRALDEVLSEALPDEVKDLRLEPSKVASAQAATLKRLAQDAYELDAFRPNLTSADADIRIAMLTAKLKLLGEPPHTL